jgi:tetratricopeptide (TPR) repeat protein
VRKLLITISIIINSLFLRAGYSVDSILVFADSQYNRGNYDLALKEYQRVGFHVGFTDPYLLYKLGNCYLSRGDWVSARNYYDQVIRTATHDSLLVYAEFKKISSLIREKSYKKALINLFGIPDSTYQTSSAEIDLLFAITYFGMEDFSTSKQYFQKMVPKDSVARAKIDSLFNEKKLIMRPSPNLAYALSMIIPGTGQIYSGRIADGINSFLLNEALVVLSIFVAYEYTILDAIISVLPWYYRYYTGGLENAREGAIEERQRRRSRLYKQTLDIIRESRNE